MIVLIAIFGLIFGSFLNVVIYRLPSGLSLIKPGSRCPICETPIRPYDNIPVFSFIFLKGRCRNCGSSISWRYPLVEAVTALCLVLLYLKFNLSTEWISYTILILFLIAISFIDIDRGLILNKLTVPGFILGVFLAGILQFEILPNRLLGALSGGFVIWLVGVLGKMIFKKDSLGMGDVKLLVMIGVYVGFPAVFICLIFSIFIAAVFILTGMAAKKLRLGDTIPFGPFIAIGSSAYVLWGEPFVQWYLALL